MLPATRKHTKFDMKNLFTPLLRWGGFRNRTQVLMRLFTIRPNLLFLNELTKELCVTHSWDISILSCLIAGHFSQVLIGGQLSYRSPNYRLRSVWNSIPSPKLPPHICLGQYSQSQTTASDLSETVFLFPNYRFRSA